ncbi:MAG: hypothetical protein NVSMB31_16920 [Vulcanimicrobiaceae bacterium]
MRVHGTSPARFLATCAAVILLGTTAFASGNYPVHHPITVAQMTASPSPTPEGQNSDQNGSTVTPAPTTIDLKQGGITGNSNGANWLDKFSRNPGPDTSGGAVNGAPANAHGMTMRLKHCTNLKTHKPMPCPKPK